LKRHVTGSVSIQGFTLIELSIVLVIIGLIVGGVLAGQDLIRLAAVRATISQIEKFNLATNTFKGKYGQLPGDLDAASATKYGFISRPGCRGLGDNNGLIEGNTNSCNLAYVGGSVGTGEPQLFWADLGQAGLIEGTYAPYYQGVGWYPTLIPNPYSSPPTTLDNSLPPAKIGNDLHVYVWSSGVGDGGLEISPINTGSNYFGISNVTFINQSYDGGSCNGCGPYYAAPTIPVRIAYMIDSKIDDGLPQSGNVRAITNGSTSAPAAAMWATPSPNSTPVTAANYNGYTTPLSPDPTTCFDNGGINGVSMLYSLTTNKGNGLNCALSFKFQ
jgi:prepilin-type N-terminal cleavage/methylation domain-containing protein